LITQEKVQRTYADAVCGSIFNSISRSKPQNNEEISIHTYDSLKWDRENEDDNNSNKYDQGTKNAKRFIRCIRRNGNSMSIYQDKAKECKCCGKHVPLPTVLKEYNGILGMPHYICKYS
jgi:hypothetical protein